MKSENVCSVDNILSQDYSFEIWKPTFYKIFPKNIPNKKSFFLWWLLYLPKLLNHHCYNIFLVYYKKKVIHYSLVGTKCFKFPFMETNDIQIGPCWTQELHRRKGIALFVILKILELYKMKNRKFWFIVREENVGSRQLIEKTGFCKYGKGIAKPKYGVNTFFIEEKYC